MWSIQLLVRRKLSCQNVAVHFSPGEELVLSPLATSEGLSESTPPDVHSSSKSPPVLVSLTFRRLFFPRPTSPPSFLPPPLMANGGPHSMSVGLDAIVGQIYTSVYVFHL